MSDRLRVGILGAGMIAGCHVRGYAAAPGVDVVAVADPRTLKAQELAGTVGARPCTDLAEVLHTGVDAVSVCTPPHSHADLTVRALEAGLHVLCEKPIAGALADARRILAAARAGDRVLMVGHVSRFEPEHRAAKEVLDSGRIGRVAMMMHSLTAPMPGWSEGGWLADPTQSGGPLLDLAVHSFDYLAWLCGSPAVRVHAVAADSPAGPRTYTVATVRYADGTMGQVEASWAHPSSRGFQAEVEICGTDGRIAWDYAGIDGGAIHGVDGVSRLEPIGERGFTREIAAFVAAVRDGGPSPVPAGAGYQALRTALAAHESVRTGRPVDLTRWEPA